MRAVESGEPYDLELRFRNAQGQRLWVRTIGKADIRDGRVVRVFGNFMDITERKKAEESLRESEELFRKLFENHSAVKVIIDPENGNIIDANEAAESYYGWSREQLKGMRIQDINTLPPEEIKKEMEKARDKKPIHFEFRHRRADGSIRDVEVFSSRIEVKEKIFLHSIIHDITDRKQAEEEIKRLNAELEQRVKERTAELEAANNEMEAFSYSVSHDLRTPVRAIGGFTEILMREHSEKLDDEARRICSVIVGNTKKMGQLIDELLSFSRLGRSEMRSSTIDMKALANSVYQELTTPETRDRVDFQIGEIGKAIGDIVLIRQVWMNLISNAIKFTAKREKPVIAITGREEGDRIIYCVKDNGAGFDMQYAGKLFGVFQRLHSDKQFEGTGVGLAIVQRVVNRHGGQVWAEGEVDKGGTFCFLLPLR
jgi:PAS domain S-box-containing protein